MKKVLIVFGFLIVFTIGYVCGAEKTEKVLQDLYMDNITSESKSEDSNWKIVENDDGSISIVDNNGKIIVDGTDNKDSDNVENKKHDVWKVKKYVNEFQEETDYTYISGVFKGVFSNSATTDSELYAQVLIDDYGVYIKLNEYGSRLVKNSSKEYADNYTVKILDSNGDSHKYSGEMEPGGDRINLTVNRGTFLELLKTGNLKVYIENEEYALTNYLFWIELANLSDLDID